MGHAGGEPLSRPRLLSANVGKVGIVPGRRPIRSAIDKRPVTGEVAVHRLGLDGDVQADRKHHGGVDQAVYAFAFEDMQAWAHRLDRNLRPGQFGENLTTSGLDITAARIGERWGIGSALLEVSDVRIPCATFQQWLGEPRWVRRFSDEGRPGAYLRVIEPGRLRAGDQIHIVEHRDHDLTVGVLFRALTSDRSLLRLVEAEPRVAAAARAVAERYAGAR